MHVLVIEDNERLAESLKNRLTQEGYQVDVATEGHEGETRAIGGQYDVIVLDLMLPDQDGLQLCRNIRRCKVASPILILTALSTTSDKVAGFDAGADDYLTKPFDTDELVARVRALTRRGAEGIGAVLTFEDLQLDRTRRTVSRGGVPIELTAKEFALLEYFMHHPDRVLTRASIGEHVWDMNFEDESNVIEVYISRLRRKVDKDYERQFIHTVTGTGYVLSADRGGS